MIKVYFLIHRRSDLTYEQFFAHWRDRHGPMLEGVPEVNRHFRRYAQNHLLDPGRSDFGYDGVSVTWADESDALAAAAAEPAFAPLWDDGTRFLDRGRSLVFAARTTSLRGEGAGDVKIMEFFRRRPEVSEATFQSALGSYVDALWDASVGLVQAELNLPADLSTTRFGAGVIDAVAEFRFEHPTALVEFNASPIKSRQISDLFKYIDLASSLFAQVRESVFFDSNRSAR